MRAVIRAAAKRAGQSESAAIRELITSALSHRGLWPPDNTQAWPPNPAFAAEFGPVPALVLSHPGAYGVTKDWPDGRHDRQEIIAGRTVLAVRRWVGGAWAEWTEVQGG